jgi:beta-lactam-binding protein with PASTA domain
MLGDSLRRRQGAPKRKRLRLPRLRLPRRGGGSGGGPLGWGWGRWVLTAIVLMGVCFGVGYLLALYVFFPVPAEAAAGVPAPDIVGHTLEEAGNAVGKVGLTVGPLDTLNSDQPAGTVLAQAPLPGQQLRAGAAMALAISAGPAAVRVPPLRGFDRADAVALLDSLGLSAASTQGLSPLPVGQVVQSTPAAGTSVARGDTVHLTVSIGAPVTQLPTPGLDTLPPPGPGMVGVGGKGRGS